MNEKHIEQPQQEENTPTQESRSETSADSIRAEIKNAVLDFLGSAVNEQGFDERDLEGIDLKIWSQYNDFKEQAKTKLIDRAQWDEFLTNFQTYKENRNNKSRAIFIDTVFQGIVDLMEKVEPNAKAQILGSISPEVKKSIERMVQRSKEEEQVIKLQTEALRKDREIRDEAKKLDQIKSTHPHIDFEKQLGPQEKEDFERELRELEKRAKEEKVKEELLKAKPDSDKVH